MCKPPRDRAIDARANTAQAHAMCAFNGIVFGFIGGLRYFGGGRAG